MTLPPDWTTNPTLWLNLSTAPGSRVSVTPLGMVRSPVTWWTKEPDQVALVVTVPEWDTIA